MQFQNEVLYLKLILHYRKSQNYNNNNLLGATQPSSISAASIWCHTTATCLQLLELCHNE